MSGVPCSVPYDPFVHGIWMDVSDCCEVLPMVHVWGGSKWQSTMMSCHMVAVWADVSDCCDVQSMFAIWVIHSDSSL